MSLALRACALLSLVLASRSVEATPAQDWEVSARAQAGWAGPLSGFGAAVHGLWVPSRYLAVGAVVDMVHLSGGGDRASNGFAFSASLLSTYVGGVGQLRVDFGPWRPFLELGMGGVIVTNQENTNNQCSVAGGPAPSAAAGVNLWLSEQLGLGVRAGGRFSAWESACRLVADGPAELTPDFILLSASAGIDLRW